MKRIEKYAKQAEQIWAEANFKADVLRAMANTNWHEISVDAPIVYASTLDRFIGGAIDKGHFHSFQEKSENIFCFPKGKSFYTSKTEDGIELVAYALPLFTYEELFNEWKANDEN